MFEVPNLDRLSTDRKDYLAAADVFYLLSISCREKASAVRCREQGAVTEAIVCEQRYEEAYRKLPPWAKWGKERP